MSSRTSVVLALTVGLLLLALISPSILAQAPAGGGPSLAAPGATSQPTTKPDEPILSVGERKLMRSELEGYLANSGAPAYQREQLRDAAMTEAAFRLLSIETVKDKPVDDEAFKKQMERVRADFALNKWFSDETTPDKLEAFVTKYPQFFDGTRVRFSQILIACPLYNSTTDQQAKLQEAESLRKRIGTGQLSFEEAATTYSAHESKSAGGDMDWIEFVPTRQDVDLVITIAAFSTPKGQYSSVIRSSRGFHLLKVTDVEPKDGKAKNWQDPKTGQIVPPQTLANLAIRAKIQNEIMQAALQKSPVVNYQQAK